MDFQGSASADIVPLQGRSQQIYYFRFAQIADAAADADDFGPGPIGRVQGWESVFGHADDLPAGKRYRLAQEGSLGQTNFREGRVGGQRQYLVQENAGAIDFGLGCQLERTRLAGDGTASRLDQYNYEHTTQKKSVH
jgi:hypothetical protein